MANSFAALKRDRQETLTNLTTELEKTQTVQTSFRMIAYGNVSEINLVMVMQ